MKRMALRSLVIAGCFIPALMVADAAQKVRPPLPKPKPAEVVNPEPEPAENATPEPEPSEAQPDAATNPFIALPREKPTQLQKAEPEATPPPEPSEAQPDAVTNPFIALPRERPTQLQKAEPEATRPPEPKPNATEAREDDKPDPGEDFELCRKDLAELGAKFSVPEMPAADGKCKVPNPVRITAIATPVGEVGFPGEPILNCVFAKRFTSWVSDIAAPVVKAQTGEALTVIATGPGYQCRGRNGDGSSKISEHAFGNAVDIASFKLASKESMAVSNVAKTGNVESRWLTALRISACGYFTTVLGPGSNEAHAEHYHFDLGLHGKSGNYRICE